MKLRTVFENHIRRSVERLTPHEGWLIFDGKKVGNDAPRLLASLLKDEKAPLARTLSMAQCHLTDAGIPQLIRILNACGNLQTLDLSRNLFTAEGLQKLIPALQAHPSLQSLRLSNMPLGGEGGALVEKLLASPPASLWELQMENASLGDEGLILAADALAKAPGVTRVCLDRNNGGPKAAEHLARWLKGNPDIAVARLVQFSEAPDTILQEAILQSDNPNLVFATPGNFPIYKLLQYNQEEAAKAANLLRRPPETLSYHELTSLTKRLSGAYAQYNNGPTHTTLEQAKARYEAHLGKLPGLPDPGPEFAAGLFTPNAHGFAPLDNPLNWHDPARVVQRLAASQAVLNEALLMRRTPNGLSMLESAAAMVPVNTLVEALNQKGIQIGRKVLLDSDRQPTPLFRDMIERGEAVDLFTVQNWYGKSGTELRQVYDALPEAQREGIALQTLLHQITPHKGLGRFMLPENNVKVEGQGLQR